MKASEDALLNEAKASAVANDAIIPRRPHRGGGREGVSYFTIPELTHSLRAQACGIDNTPTAAAVPLMVELITKVLDPIREKWQSPIYITSGYRCPALNEEVGGVEGSYHTRGMAADITATDPTRNVELMSLIRAMHLTGKLALTECYLGPKARYIHIALDRTHLDEYPFI